MVDVADLTDGGLAAHRDHADLAGGQANLRPGAFLSHQLRRVAGGADELSALAGQQLDAVDQGTQRDVGDGHRVAGLDVSLGAAEDRVAHMQAVGSDDVALLAVGINQKSDVGAAVGVVFNGRNLGGDAVLVALEVDDAVLSARRAAAEADGDLAVDVASAGGALIFKQRLLRRGAGDFLVSGNRHEAAARRGRLIELDSHP